MLERPTFSTAQENIMEYSRIFQSIPEYSEKNYNLSLTLFILLSLILPFCHYLYLFLSLLSFSISLSLSVSPLVFFHLFLSLLLSFPISLSLSVSPLVFFHLSLPPDDEGEESEAQTAAEGSPAGPAQGQPVFHPALGACQPRRKRVGGFSQERPCAQQQTEWKAATDSCSHREWGSRFRIVYKLCRYEIYSEIKTAYEHNRRGFFFVLLFIFMFFIFIFFI